MVEKILEVKNLRVSMFAEGKKLQIIRGLDLSLYKGEIIGILGESGSGKTVSMSSILRLYETSEMVFDSGNVIFNNEDLLLKSEKQLNRIRGNRISYVFQNPAQALHPYKKIGKQLTAFMKAHKLPVSKENILAVLTEAGLDEPSIIYDKFPHQLSAGQNQRIMIAQCILCKPDLIIADEPTSSVDASLRKKILDLFLYINKKYKTSIIVITHDFDIVKYMCSRLVIMYGGLNVEQGNLKDVLKDPLHPYTNELIKCAESLENDKEELYSLQGSPLSPLEFENSCPFYSRCNLKRDECLKCIPAPIEVAGRRVRCIEPVINSTVTAVKQELI